MLKKVILLIFCCLCMVCFAFTPSKNSLVMAQIKPPVDYDIVYVRCPRKGDQLVNYLPEAFTPLLPEPNSDLMLLHPNGSEEILFSGGLNGAVMDPSISYDAQSVIFCYFPNVTNVNTQRRSDYGGLAMSRDGADTYRMELATRKVTRLTFQEFSPNTGNGANYDCSRPDTNCPQVGVFNTGPAFLPDGRIVYTSTRDNYIPNKPKAHTGLRVMQLWVMDGDGKNQHVIGHFNLSEAMHPFVLKDGRIIFTSWENMGSRDDRSFMLWSIWPDGTNFDTFSGFGDTDIAHHFMTQASNGDIVVCRYYNLNNNGFGELYSFPVQPPSDKQSAFQPLPDEKQSTKTDFGLKRWGYTRLTPFTTADDFPAPCFPGDLVTQNPCPNGNQNRVGKFSHPSAAPNNSILVSYTRGSANHKLSFLRGGLDYPLYDSGIYAMRSDQILNTPDQLTLIKNDPAYNEIWPRAVVPYQAIYGVPAPVDLPRLANDGKADARLPEGTPLALIGTSSLISRDTSPLFGDPFFQHLNNGNRNWIFQGADAGVYSDQDVYAVRILAMQPTSDLRYPNNGRGFTSNFNERIRILGEIPVRKEGTIDAQGNVDTSFLAKIPGNVPFTFQTLDRNGLVLNTAQTWHSVQPGEMRVNCGGCHAHAKPSLDFKSTLAAKATYSVRDLSQTTPLLNVDGSQNPSVTESSERFKTLEYFRDIRPIFQAKCVSCHQPNGAQSGGLDLSDSSYSDFSRSSDYIPDGLYPSSYATLAIHKDPVANPLPRSISPKGDWYWPQVTRYIRAGQARQSLLAWKIFGKRLDGRRNEDRPTESVPGNPATIPFGYNFYDCDLDYTGEQMPPPSSGIALSWEERMKIIRWIDIGSPIDISVINTNLGYKSYAGFLEDDLRPTLSLLPSVAQAAKDRKLSRLVIGTYDLESGINPNSLIVTMNRAIGAFPAGTNLASAVTISNGGTVTINLPTPIDLIDGESSIFIEVRDQANHATRIERTYSRAKQAAASVSAGSYASNAILAPDSIISLFGINLAMETLLASSLPLPTTLAGTTVIIKDSLGVERSAGLFYVSPSQINYLLPTDIAAGTATVIVSNSSGIFSTGTIEIARIAPALFSADANGQGVAAAQAQRVRGTTSTFEEVAQYDPKLRRFTGIPINVSLATDQVYLALYGTGIRNRSNVTAKIGGVEATVVYSGAHGFFVGVDQVNVLIPRSLAGRGDVDIVLTVDGKTANTVRVNIK